MTCQQILRGQKASLGQRILWGTALVAALAAADFQSSKAFAQLNEIIVTTRKREESLQDVPISVNAFTAQKIKELGVDDISRLSDFTANFSFEKFGARRGAQDDVSRPVIRGQSNVLGEPNAAFFVDGVLFSENILSFPFASVERVEVVRGPQSALFGRSTFAGAVNLITKKGTNEFENQLSLRAATHDDFEVNVSSSGPVIEDKLFYFIGGRFYDYGGEYKNEIDGGEVGEEQSWGLDGSLELRANEDLNIVLRGGYYEDDAGYAPERTQDRFSNNCFLDQARQYFCGEVSEFESVRLVSNADMGGNQGLRREVIYGSLTIDWDLAGSDWVLTSNSGYSAADSEFGVDASRLGDPLGLFGNLFRRVEVIQRHEWSTELRLASPTDKRVRGMIGGYYYKRNFDEVYKNPISETVRTDLGTKTARNVAVFGSLEVDVIEPVTVRGELRWQSDKIGFEPAVGMELESTFESVLPRVTVDWDITDNNLAYVAVAKGNKPGNFNTNPALPESARFADEESAWNYEIGLKSDLWDGRARLNVAAFYIDWTDQQLTTSISVAGQPISFISNAGETRVWGIELEGSAFLTEQFEVGGSYGLSDAEFKENCDVVQGAELTGFDCVNPDTGAAGGSVKGNQTPNSPKHQFSAFAQYTHPLSNMDVDLFFRTDYAYRSKVFSQVHNLAFVGDRHLLNLKTGFTKGDFLRFTLFVDNVLDDLTPSTVVRFADLANLNVAPNANPALDNVPGTTSIERGFLVPLADGRKFGITIDLSF